MFNDDIEYNNDGTINQAAYDEEEYEFFQIMYGPKEQTDDWENDYISEEAEYDLNTSDYNDRDEFESAVEEAKFQREIQDDDLDSDDTDDGSFDSNTEFDGIDDDTDAAVFPEGFDFSRLRFTIGSEVKVTLDDEDDNDETTDTSSFEAAKAAFLAAGLNGAQSGTNKSKSVNNKNTTEYVPHTKSVQIKYYDKDERKYNIEQAIYDYFAGVRNNFDLDEIKSVENLLETIYKYDKDLAIKIWRWVLEKFPKALVNDGVDEFDSQAEDITGWVLYKLCQIDSDYILEYISKNQDMEEILFGKSYFEEELDHVDYYVAYCVKNNLREHVSRVYKGIVNHPFRNKKKWGLYAVLEVFLYACINEDIENADPWFYKFFEKQIRGLNKPIKENALMELLNEDHYGTPIFAKPINKTAEPKPLTKEQKKELKNKYKEEHKTEEYSADEDFDFVVDTASQDEVAKLREELSMVKSKCETFEEQIKKLTDEIKTLKAQNEPEAFYCRIHFENSAKGQAFWYKCDDTTVKVGDSVTAPFGYKNDELIGTVVEAGYFKSCDFDFPISKMKAIIEKKD